jgi:hypothetical protein
LISNQKEVFGLITPISVPISVVILMLAKVVFRPIFRAVVRMIGFGMAVLVVDIGVIVAPGPQPNNFFRGSVIIIGSEPQVHHVDDIRVQKPDPVMSPFVVIGVKI